MSDVPLELVLADGLVLQGDAADELGHARG